jgi:hypothetical protein
MRRRRCAGAGAGTMDLTGLASFADVTRRPAGARCGLAVRALFACNRFARPGCDLGRVRRLVYGQRLRHSRVADDDHGGVTVAQGVSDSLGYMRPGCSTGRAHVSGGDLGHGNGRGGRASVACRTCCAAEAARRRWLDCGNSGTSLWSSLHHRLSRGLVVGRGSGVGDHIGCCEGGGRSFTRLGLSGVNWRTVRLAGSL